MIRARHFSRTAAVAAALTLAAALAAPATASATARPVDHVHQPARSSNACPPAAVALSFTDGLSKLNYHGVEVGGLSSLAYDRRSKSWVSAVDNHASDPARIWFFRSLTHPTVVRDPLVLKRPDGTAYDGTTSDNEGLAVLPNGDFLVSSETEPSIRIYSRNGLQKAALPIPARFAVTGTTPDGQATSNATLEGLTVTPRGNEIIAAMEGALSGDVSAAGDATLHRFLVYDRDHRGRWRLTKQIAYRAEPGMRIPEIAAYSQHKLLVEEASFSTTTGNAVDLYAVTGLRRARDVTNIADLSQARKRDIVTKTEIADLVKCPTLGATSLETQANPLLDNYEGMAITTPRGRHGYRGVSLISDDNFSASQNTRLLNLAARLP